MKGMGMSNAQWRPYTSREIAGALDLRPDNLLFLAYPGDSSQPDRIAQEADLCRALGITAPLVRVYLTEVMRRNPRDVAWECYLIVQQYKAAGLSPELLGANELNHPGERGLPEGAWVEDWEQQIRWLKEFASDFRMRSPKTVLHLPALSPHGEYFDGWAAYEEAGLPGLFDEVDAHVYSFSQLGEILGATWYFRGKTRITEWNQLPTQEIVNSGIPSFYFICDSDDPAFWQYSLLRQPELYTDFKQAKEGLDMEYVLGFADLAKRLGYVIVGNPEMDQVSIPIGDGRTFTLQLTDRGMFVYTEGGQPKFLEATGPL